MSIGEFFRKQGESFQGPQPSKATSSLEEAARPFTGNQRKWDGATKSWIETGPDLVPDPGATVPGMMLDPAILEAMRAGAPVQGDLTKPSVFNFDEAIGGSDEPASKKPESGGQGAALTAGIIAAGVIGVGLGVVFGIGVLGGLIWLLG